MAATCIDCAETLGIKRRLLGKDRCAICARKRAEEVRREHELAEVAYDAAVAAYREVVDQLEPGVDLEIVGRRIREAMRVTPLATSEVEHLNSGALARFFSATRADGVIDPREDRFLSQALRLLGLQFTPEQLRDYVVAALDGGLIVRDPAPQIGVLNSGEVPHWNTPAELLEEHVETELRWTSAGPSLPIGEGGIRAHLETGRGQLVETGRVVRVADRGVLSVTSQRVVFGGESSTYEYPLERLLGVRLFTDGVGLQIVNGKQMPVFRTGAIRNEIVGAVAVSAAQRSKGTFVPRDSPPLAPKPAPRLPKMLVAAGYSDPVLKS